MVSQNLIEWHIWVLSLHLCPLLVDQFLSSDMVGHLVIFLVRYVICDLVRHLLWRLLLGGVNLLWVALGG